MCPFLASFTAIQSLEYHRMSELAFALSQKGVTDMILYPASTATLTSTHVLPITVYHYKMHKRRKISGLSLPN